MILTVKTTNHCLTKLIIFFHVIKQMTNICQVFKGV